MQTAWRWTRISSFESSRRASNSIFGPCFRLCSLTWSGAGCTGLNICADLLQTILTATLLIPGILRSNPSGPVLCTVQIRSRRIGRPISPTALAAYSLLPEPPFNLQLSPVTPDKTGLLQLRIHYDPKASLPALLEKSIYLAPAYPALETIKTCVQNQLSFFSGAIRQCG